MSEGRRRFRLRDLCDSIDYGLTASATDAPVGPRFLRITDIVQGHIDWSTVPYVGASNSDTEKYRLRPGDIVVARTGATTGYSACVLNPPEAIFASYLVRFSISSRHHSRFVGYLLKGPQWWAYIHGVLGDKSAQPNASAATLGDAWLDVPNFPEQRAIAETLGALDDKIESNRNLCSIVGGLVQAAVEAAQAQAECLITLGDLVERVNDIAKPEELYRATVYVGLEHMPRGSLFLTEWGSAEELASAKARFQGGDILFGKLRPYFRKVVIAPMAGVCSTDVLVLRPRHSEQRMFALVVCASDGVSNYASAGSHGTRMPRVSWDYLSAWQLPAPGKDAMRALQKRVEPMVKHAVQLTQESNVLAQLRDALLPRLLSGEVRVRDAAQLVGEAM